jgi:hypothetical protein
MALRRSVGNVTRPHNHDPRHQLHDDPRDRFVAVVQRHTDQHDQRECARESGRGRQEQLEHAWYPLKHGQRLIGTDLLTYACRQRNDHLSPSRLSVLGRISM